MTWLLWKDFRLARPLFVVTLLLLIVPHGWAVVAACLQHSGMFAYLASNLRGSVRASIVLEQLPLLLLGGLTMAGERGDRSAEFLAGQPISRSHIVLSKVLVALGLIALIWIPNLLLVALVSWLPSPMPRNPMLGQLWADLISTALLGFMAFGVAWLFSAWLESPTFSACAGVMVPAILQTGIMAVTRWQDMPQRYVFPVTCFWLALALLSFIGGTVHYLRRVEP